MVDRETNLESQEIVVKVSSFFNRNLNSHLTIRLEKTDLSFWCCGTDGLQALNQNVRGLL